MPVGRRPRRAIGHRTLRQSGDRGLRENLNDELNRRAWKDTLPRFALRPGALDQKRYTRFADFLMKERIVSVVPELATWALELP